LNNEGPKDITELVIIESAKMLQLAGIEKNFVSAKKKVINQIVSGKALQKFKELIEFQHGDTKLIDKPKILLQTKYCEPVLSQTEGYVSFINTKLVGIACCVLGGGRQKLGDKIDYSVGMKIVKKLNDYVEKGEPLVYIYFNDKQKFEQAKNIVLNAYKISSKKTVKPKLIHKEIC